MTNTSSLEDALSKKPILRKRPAYLPLSRDNLDLDEEVLNWLVELESKNLLNLQPLYSVMLKSCIDAVAINPDLGNRINELYSDTIDFNVNGILYTGKYKVDGFDAPLFYKLQKRKRCGFKALAKKWSKKSTNKKS